MSRDWRLRLGDIVEACARVAAYIEGYDALRFHRQFEIIGEAVKALPAEMVASEPSIPWNQIAGFRDVLAHSYFAVDSSVVWDAASNKAPALRIACEKLLAI